MSASPAAVAAALPRLPDPVPRSGVSDTARLALRQYLADGEREHAGAFRAGVDAEVLVAARTATVERLLVHCWRAWLGDGAEAALLAVGGFGRCELFPFSDVDLLVLTAPAPDARLTRAIEALFRCLWDIGLRPGHAVRDPVACREIAGADVTVYTNLLDARFVAGTRALADDLIARLPAPDLWPPLRYLEAKRAEQAARHARYGDTAYNLEPQIKDGPGGLRDLHLVRWLGRVVAGSADADARVRADLLDPREIAALAAARATLFRIRYALHLVAGRAEERLLFDFQRDLARGLGYADEHAQNLAVEQFMQGYFRAARVVASLNEELIERCAETLVPAVAAPVPVGADFVRIGDRFDTADEDALRRRPTLLVGLFAAAATAPGVRGLRAGALRRVRQALADPALDLERPEVFAALRRVFELGVPAVEVIAALARHGVLARLLPAFARVSGRMQYDLFHVYTVDEHTLRVLRYMARFAEAEGAREFPLAHEVIARLPQPALLLLAGLFHDIAKGRGGDHSELGEADARAFCARLGFAAPETELVAWLVRWHLLLSVTAQRQDITDPAVVHRFAAHVADWERLDYLYVLTVADICGTSPRLWNGWKARLLDDLYTAARFMLREQPGAPPHADERMAACQARARMLLLARGLDAGAIARAWAELPDESFLRHAPEQVAWQAEAIATAGGGELPLVRIAAAGARGASEVLVYSPDRDGLFATVTAVLDRLRLNVVEARVLASRSGMALDTFLVLDAHGRALAEGAATEGMEHVLREALRQDPLRTQPARRALPRALRHFQTVPQLAFVADSGGRTRLALTCSDRPGLLAAVAQAFRERSVRVHDARIATFGERVEDFFEITDERDRALDAAAMDALRAALVRRLQAATETHSKDVHARA